MGRSQRHKKQIQGKISKDRQDAKAQTGDYMGSNMRAGAVAGANTKGRAGGATSEPSVMGAGYLSGGYSGTSTKGTANAAVSGGIQDPIQPTDGWPPYT